MAGRAGRGGSLEISIDAVGLSRLHAELKIAQNDVRKQLRRRIGGATIPLRERIKANARVVRTKQGGGLAKVQDAVRTTQYYGSRGAIVRVRVSRAKAPYAAEGVYFRHPVYGNRQNWVRQPAQHEFFDRAIEGSGAAMEAEMMKVLTDIIGMLAHG